MSNTPYRGLYRQKGRWRLTLLLDDTTADRLVAFQVSEKRLTLGDAARALIERGLDAEGKVSRPPCAPKEAR